MVVVKLVIMIQDWHIDSLPTWWDLGKGEFGGGFSKSKKSVLQFYFSLLMFQLGR